MICLLTNIKTGVEKARREFARGEVAFLPSNGLICVFLGSVRSDRPLNPIGRLDHGLEVMEKIAAGDVVELSLVQEATVHT
jgi:hypothetical protein